MCCDANGNPITPNWPLFRQQFPQYEDDTVYSDALLQMYWDEVLCFVSDKGYNLIGQCRLFLLNLFVAHMLTLNAQAQRGKQGGFITSSTIDKVSVQKVAPPSANQFQWWLNQTPWGQQAATMLYMATVGGDYIGGLPEQAAFRRVGGVFAPQTFGFGY